MQNIFKNLRQVFLGGASGGTTGADRDGLYFYIRCDRCGEVIQVRLNRYNDLTIEYGENGERGDTRHAHKVIVGKRCYNRIEADFTFDRNYKLTEQKATGGKFVPAGEYTPENS